MTHYELSSDSDEPKLYSQKDFDDLQRNQSEKEKSDKKTRYLRNTVTGIVVAIGLVSAYHIGKVEELNDIVHYENVLTSDSLPNLKYFNGDAKASELKNLESEQPFMVSGYKAILARRVPRKAGDVTYTDFYLVNGKGIVSVNDYQMTDKKSISDLLLGKQ